MGYLRAVSVRPDPRSRGLGRALVAHAAARVFRESPNVCLWVSSFNSRARALYARPGCTLVADFTHHIVRGHSEWLLRTSRGPLADYPAARPGPLPADDLAPCSP